MRGVIDIVDSLITPAASPMTVDYARRHIKALSHSEDVLIANWIQAATQYFEEQTNRQIGTATWEAWLDRFPGSFAYGVDATSIYQQWPCYGGTSLRIELPHPPLQSVTSIQYIDSDGNLQDVTDGASPAVDQWQVKAPVGPYARRGWVEPLAGLNWPIARYEGGAVRIRYVAGYGATPGDVPELITGILCYLVGHFDQVRNAVQEVRRGQMLELPFGVQMMMDGFKYSAYSTRSLGSWPDHRGFY